MRGKLAEDVDAVINLSKEDKSVRRRERETRSTKLNPEWDQNRKTYALHLDRYSSINFSHHHCCQYESEKTSSQIYSRRKFESMGGAEEVCMC